MDNKQTTEVIIHSPIEKPNRQQCYNKQTGFNTQQWSNKKHWETQISWPPQAICLLPLVSGPLHCQSFPGRSWGDPPPGTCRRQSTSIWLRPVLTWHTLDLALSYLHKWKSRKHRNKKNTITTLYTAPVATSNDNPLPTMDGSGKGRQYRKLGCVWRD